MAQRMVDLSNFNLQKFQVDWYFRQLLFQANPILNEKEMQEIYAGICFFKISQETNMTSDERDLDQSISRSDLESNFDDTEKGYEGDDDLNETTDEEEQTKENIMIPNQLCQVKSDNNQTEIYDILKEAMKVLEELEEIKDSNQVKDFNKIFYY